MLAQILFLMFICFIPSQFIYFIIQVFNFSHNPSTGRSINTAPFYRLIISPVLLTAPKHILK